MWWKNYGWKNFLWFSDIAFIGAVPAMWLQSSALASVLTVAVLLPELLWNVDYALRLQRELDAGRLWINAYSHDVSIYIASNRLLNEGGYEVNNSLNSLVTYGHPERLQPPVEDRIVEQVKKMLFPAFGSR